MNLEGLRLEKVIYEIRYPDGQLYLDRCGRIQKKVLEKWPKLTHEGTDPQHSQFFDPVAGFEFDFGTQRLNASHPYPEKFDPFPGFCSELSEIVLSIIDVKIISRAGNRYLFFLPAPTTEEASRCLHGVFHNMIPMEKLGHMGEDLAQPGLKFIVAGKRLSYRVVFDVVERQLAIKVPKPVRTDLTDFSPVGLSVDVDAFTNTSIERTKFEPEVFLKEAFKAVKSTVPDLLAHFKK